MRLRKSKIRRIYNGLTIAILSAAVTFCVANPFGLFAFDEYTKFRMVYNLMENEFYKDISDEDKLDGILLGLSYSADDPYTVYMDKENNEAFVKEIDKEDYVGIGVYITASSDDNSVVVISAFDGSPAAKAGITTGDKILKVDGEQVSGDNLDDCSNRVQGVAGSTVNLEILKADSGEIVKLNVTRDAIDVRTVTSKMLDDNIGVIRISQFSVDTYDEFVEDFNSLADNNLAALILDLRNNPGGYMDVAVNIADAFIEDNLITYTLDKNGNKQEYKAESGKTDVPMVILLNEGSASASEVLSGALRDCNNVKIIGEKSFGKGVVQSVYPFEDGSSLKVTTARYYTPSGYCIDETKGLEPDIKVEIPENSDVDITSFDVENDPQLKAAVDYFKE